MKVTDITGLREVKQEAGANKKEIEAAKHNCRWQEVSGLETRGFLKVKVCVGNSRTCCPLSHPSGRWEVYSLEET